MKRILGSMAAIVILTLSAAAWANPPSAIHISYDPARGEIDVTVQHPVTDRFEHYISEIQLTKNGSVVEKRTFDSQTSHRNQTTPPFKVQAAPGDDLRVKAVCNHFGSAEEQVKIPALAAQ